MGRRLWPSALAWRSWEPLFLCGPLRFGRTGLSLGCWRPARARWRCACTGSPTPPTPGVICCRPWHDWSPGYDAGEDLARAKESLREPANLAAAIGYYRATGTAGGPGGSSGAAGGPGTADLYLAEEQAAGRQAPQPTLYLHGAA